MLLMWLANIYRLLLSCIFKLSSGLFAMLKVLYRMVYSSLPFPLLACLFTLTLIGPVVLTLVILFPIIVFILVTILLRRVLRNNLWFLGLVVNLSIALLPLLLQRFYVWQLFFMILRFLCSIILSCFVTIRVLSFWVIIRCLTNLQSTLSLLSFCAWTDYFGFSSQSVCSFSFIGCRHFH